MAKNKIIITAPSLDPTINVSGVSSVVQFIMDNNKEAEYIHFQLGKTDRETGLWNRISRIFRSYRTWKRTLAEHPEALIHYSFPLSTPSILRDPLFMHYALKQRRKMVVHMHGGLYLTAKHIPILQREILRWVFSWNVPFIVLSETEKEILNQRWGAKDVTVLPNCPEAPVSCERKTSDTLTLGYLGRIEVNKGMKELLEACKRLKADGIHFKLLFAGKEVNEREFIPSYQQELGSRFEYVGLVSSDRKREFLQSLDILVMPTYFEGLPMSLLECMSYGVVPVITHVGSISSVVRDKENGLFVKLRDADSIVECITYLDAHRETLRQLGDNARETIAANFSPERYVEELNKVYIR